MGTQGTSMDRPPPPPPSYRTFTGCAVIFILPQETASSGRAPASLPSKSDAVLMYTEKSAPLRMRLALQMWCLMRPPPRISIPGHRDTLHGERRKHGMGWGWGAVGAKQSCTQRSSAQLSAAQRSSAQLSAAQRSSAQLSAAQRSSAQLSAA